MTDRASEPDDAAASCGEMKIFADNPELTEVSLLLTDTCRAAFGHRRVSGFDGKKAVGVVAAVAPPINQEGAHGR